VQVRPDLVANAQPLELVQPGEAMFHDPTDAPQSWTMDDASAGDTWNDAALAKCAAVDVVVVARLTSRSA
jgi:hypothetical protein